MAIFTVSRSFGCMSYPVWYRIVGLPLEGPTSEPLDSGGSGHEDVRAGAVTRLSACADIARTRWHLDYVDCVSVCRAAGRRETPLFWRRVWPLRRRSTSRPDAADRVGMSKIGSAVELGGQTRRNIVRLRALGALLRANFPLIGSRAGHGLSPSSTSYRDPPELAPGTHTQRDRPAPSRDCPQLVTTAAEELVVWVPQGCCRQWLQLVRASSRRRVVDLMRGIFAPREVSSQKFHRTWQFKFRPVNAFGSSFDGQGPTRFDSEGRFQIR